MRILAAILWLSWLQPAIAQNMNLTSLQHEIRWLDELRFHPLVKDPAVAQELLQNTAAALSRKFNTEGFTTPGQVDYKVYTMFGKPHLKPPAKTKNSGDYQASVLSFITRATTGYEVLWHMKAEVIQNGKTVYSREISHEILQYEPGVRWFNDSSFLEHFSMLINELLELGPPLAYKYVLGGTDYATLLQTEGNRWKVNQHSNALGFGLPSFGPYVTLDAGKLDTAVIRTKKVLDKESSLGMSGNRFSFDQFKTIDNSKTTFCFLQLDSNADTLEATYSVRIRRLGAKRTFLSELLSDEDDNNEPSVTKTRNVVGIIRTDTLAWQFAIQNYGTDGSIAGGYLSNDQHNYRLVFRQHKGLHKEIHIADPDGAQLGRLDFRLSGSEIFLLKDLDRHTEQAIAVLYAVLVSVKNAQ